MLTIYGNDEREAALYYLYMMADGRISYSEEQMFRTLCLELRIDERSRNEVIDYCLQIREHTLDMLFVIMGVVIPASDDNRFVLPRGTFSDYARMIWNLVNLGYADADYSEAEKEIVRYLMDKWKVPKVLYQEMIATADTMAALTKQRGWVLDTYAEGLERDEKLKRIDEAIDKLHRNIKISIQELVM